MAKCDVAARAGSVLQAKEAGPSESQLAASETAVKAAEEEIKAMREAKKDKRKIKAKDAELAKLKDANATLQASAAPTAAVNGWLLRTLVFFCAWCGSRRRRIEF